MSALRSVVLLCDRRSILSHRTLSTLSHNKAQRCTRTLTVKYQSVRRYCLYATKYELYRCPFDGVRLLSLSHSKFAHSSASSIDEPTTKQEEGSEGGKGKKSWTWKLNVFAACSILSSCTLLFYEYGMVFDYFIILIL